MMMLSTPSPVLPQHLRIGVPGWSGVAGEVLADLEDQPAGPWLAVLLDEIDPGSLTAVELIEYLKACQRMASWAEARTTVGVAELSRRPDVDCPDKEVALALRIPARAADRVIFTARRLSTKLPELMRRHRDGNLTAAHVQKVVAATGRIDDPDVLAGVQDRVLARAAGKTADELARHARDAVRDLDPGGAQQRAKAARDHADVVLYPADEDGMADLAARLPIEDAAIVKAGIDAYAITAKQTGDPRRLGVLRAEGLTRMASAYLTGDTVGPAPSSGGRPIEIGITVDLPTALGIRDLPGQVPGHGLVPRDAIAQLIAQEAPRLRLMVIDEHTGRLLHRATHGYRPTPAQIAQIRATYPFSAGPGSTVPAGRCDIDHAAPHPQGKTVIGNLAPFDRSWHRDKTHHGVQVAISDDGTITVTTSLGQTRTVAPHDYRTCLDDPSSSPDVAKHDASPAGHGTPPF